jgi:hypothetical protein
VQTVEATGYGIVPDLLLWGLLGTLGGFSLWAASLPVGDFLTGVCLVLLWGACALSWIAAGFVTLRSAHRRRRAISRWVVAPSVVLALVAAYSTGLPGRARFSLSRAALNRAADEVERGHPFTGRVGYYTVEHSEQVGDAVVLFLVDHGFMLSSAYLTRDSPPASEEFCQRLDTHWRLCTIAD